LQNGSLHEKGWKALVYIMLGLIKNHKKYRNHEVPRSIQKVFVVNKSNTDETHTPIHTPNLVVQKS